MKDVLSTLAFTQTGAKAIDPSQIHNCDFCNYFQNDPANRLLFHSENFYVALDFSPMIEGHLMIMSKEHFGCAGEIDDDNRKVELSKVKCICTQLALEVFGYATFYEHGRAGHCVRFPDSDIVCEHFHLHLLPKEIDVAARVESDFEFHLLEDYQDLTSTYNRHGNYLYVEVAGGPKYFFKAPDDKIPSHYLRTRYAEALSTLERDDWETYRNPEEVQLAHTKYLDAMRKDARFTNLPK